MADMDEDILKEFLVESMENLDQVDSDLVDLERMPGSQDLVDRIFRAVHTVKGTCGFFGFSRLEEIAHAGETLLARMREGRLTATSEIVSALLATMDAIRTIIASIERDRTEGTADQSELVARLIRLSSGSSGGDRASRMRLFDQMIADGKLAERQVELAVERQRQGDPRRLGELLVEQGALQTQDVLDALLTRGGAHRPGAEDHVRVDLRLLDHLMDLVGELVLARNQMLQLVEGHAWDDLPAVSQRIHQVTSRLQDEVMGTRMQAMHTLWNKLPRLARDVSGECGKRVRLVLDGGDTDLDKSLVDAIRDPLTHLVRNAIDHGIEKPEERIARGKPEEGSLTLRAYHEGEQVVIDVTDDGAGMSIPRIREKAIERGVVPRGSADRLADQDWLNLIFLPGFSTAEQVSTVSGRGVGMDVVRANVERIGGTIELRSEEGRGTTVSMRIPLTLAIIPALMVADTQQRYAVPQAHLRELVRLRTAAIADSIADIQGTPVLRLRGGLIPLVDLGALLETSEPAARDPMQILVLEAGGRTFGLVVDAVHDTQEIVVKPLPLERKGQGPFAGATVLGDGDTCLILNIAWIAARSGAAARARDEAPMVPAQGSGEALHVLVVRLGEDGRFAIPLDQVTRLEKFTPGAFENLRGSRVVQYRGRPMPVLQMSELLPGAPGGWSDTRELWSVIVHTGPRGVVGLAVDEILDVASPDQVHDTVGAATGIAGSAVLMGRTTELVDLGALLGGHAAAMAGVSGSDR